MKYLIALTLSALFMTTLSAHAEDGSERLRQMHAKHLERQYALSLPLPTVSLADGHPAPRFQLAARPLYNTRLYGFPAFTPSPVKHPSRGFVPIKTQVKVIQMLYITNITYRICR